MPGHGDNEDAGDPIDVSTLDDLVGVLEDLDARLTHLEERPPAVEDTSPEDFTEWVEWLRQTYALESRIRDTWQDGAAIVAELRALHVAHQAAYGEGAGAFDPLTWHDGLARVVHRLSEWDANVRQRAARTPS